MITSSPSLFCLRHSIVALACIACNVHAQSYPEKPVRIIVPFAPGGGTDFVARLIAQKLNENWRQAVVVDNRPGASGVRGTELVAKAPPDGYTLVIATAELVITPNIMPHIPYDPIKSFTPITQATTQPYIVVVHPSVLATSVKELIAVIQAIRDPTVRKLFIDGGAEPMPSNSPEEFGAFIHTEITKWAKVATEAHIPPQ